MLRGAQFGNICSRPLTGLRTTEAIGTMGWTVLPHPPYLPDLAPSDLHLSGPLEKNALRRHCFADDIDLNRSVHEEL